jgi:hypothetical protein
MGRKCTIIKNRVYVECSNENRKVKGFILSKSDNDIKVKLPSGFVMNLKKRHKNGIYLFQLGVLEFSSDGHPVA